MLVGLEGRGLRVADARLFWTQTRPSIRRPRFACGMSGFETCLVGDSTRYGGPQFLELMVYPIVEHFASPPTGSFRCARAVGRPSRLAQSAQPRKPDDVLRGSRDTTPLGDDAANRPTYASVSRVSGSLANSKHHLVAPIDR